MKYFEKAVPVWAENLQNEMNITCRFEGRFVSVHAVLHIAAATVYRVWLNERMIAYGPARCGHGTYRVDEWKLDKYLCDGMNRIVIETVGYNINCYAYLDQPSFLQAEISGENGTLLFTGKDGGFSCGIDKRRVQKAQRYSFQRAFTEAYDYRANLLPAFMEECGLKQLTWRNIPLPVFTAAVPVEVMAEGCMASAVLPRPAFKGRATAKIGETIKGFVPDDLDAYLTDELGKYVFVSEDGHEPCIGRYVTYRFERNTTGFIAVNVEAHEDLTLYAVFDERLDGDDVNYLRMGCVNAVRWKLPKGWHRLLTMEPYTLKYLKICSPDGVFDLKDVSITEYKGNLPLLDNPVNGDEQLKMIYDATVETLLQNSPDIFMDCPSRERAGWLCDSFFTSRGEKAITGTNIIEHNFLENFLFADNYKYLPDGMLPMCYPSDHNDGNFIPNWAMWLVLELEDNLKRTGSRELVDRFENKINALLVYFKGFENEYGLLEDLDGWIFIDWSRANDPDVVCGVNWPSNMLYACMLKAISNMYSRQELAAKADLLFEMIRRESFNGTYFSDNAVRVNGTLITQAIVTEACQSYAFFTGTADPELYPELWARFRSAFKGENGNILYPQNAFIGFYIRLAALDNYGAYDVIENDIRRVFGPQAALTGTLWERMTDGTSLNHGFTAYTAELIKKILDNRA